MTSEVLALRARPAIAVGLRHRWIPASALALATTLGLLILGLGGFAGTDYARCVDGGHPLARTSGPGFRLAEACRIPRAVLTGCAILSMLVAWSALWSPILTH